MTCKQVAMPDSKLPQGKATVKGQNDGALTIKKNEATLRAEKRGSAAPFFPEEKP